MATRSGQSPRTRGGTAGGATSTTPKASREWSLARVVIGPTLAVAVVALAGTIACQVRPDAGAAPPSATAAAPVGATIRVHVTGAVQAPGVYELRAGDRVQEAVHAAGGVTADADAAALNLAQRVHDEQRLDVPARAPVAAAGSADTPGPQPATAPPVVAAPRAAPTAPTAPAADADLEALLASPSNPEGGARLNVNVATVAQLEKLPGIGAVSAGRVAAWRTEHGAIHTVADLRAAGLTAAILRKALPYLTIS